MSVAESLLTAEEFAALSDLRRPSELVRGRVVMMNQPWSRHGQICNKVGRILGNFAEAHDLGHVLNNDSGVVTERQPDTVRGPDVAFFSFARVPRGRLPARRYVGVPEVVVEVRSADDRWAAILEKVGEYLNAGVLVAIVLDDDDDAAYVYRPDRPPEKLGLDGEIPLPEVHPEFRLSVRACLD